MSVGVAAATTSSMAVLTAPMATFTWSMPDRFGFDGNEDGVFDIIDDPNDPMELAFAQETSFQVDLDASASQGGPDGIASYQWEVRGNGMSAPIFLAGQQVSFSGRQGTYAVTLTVTGADGLTSSSTQAVLIKDILIVAIGDSYASGEGNPDIPIRFDDFGFVRAGAHWTDSESDEQKWGTTDRRSRCHRSASAGAAQAALAIERADPHSSVTFVFVACSGATIDTGVLGSYNGIEDPVQAPLLPPQLTQLQLLLGMRDVEIDALLMSIGGNDIGFASIVQALVMLPLGMYEPLPGLDGRTWDAVILDKLVELPGKYQLLSDRIAGAFRRVPETFITEYPDPTTYFVIPGQLATCPLILNDIAFVPLAFFGTIGWVAGTLGADFTELNWARTSVLNPLNNRILDAATAQDWHYVGGISQAFAGRGYCAAGSWIRSATDSVALQGPIFTNYLTTVSNPVSKAQTDGTMHPTQDGHAAYATSLRSQVEAVAADMGLSLTAPSGPVETGSGLTYTIRLENTGPSAAASVSWFQELPSSLVVKSCSLGSGASCFQAGGSQTATVSSIEPGAAETVTLSATVPCTVPDGTRLATIGSVGALTRDPNPENNLQRAAAFAVDPPPRIACPANQVVPADQPAGAVHAYPAPVVTDNCGSTVPQCSPASGSLFAVGTTTVTCATTDTGGNASSCGFTVHVKGPGEQATDLMAATRGLSLPDGIANSLLVKLEKALADIDAGQTLTACADLTAFINEVMAQLGKLLTADQADELVRAASRLKAVLGCR